jgi:hypothetical protein
VLEDALLEGEGERDKKYHPTPLSTMISTTAEPIATVLRLFVLTVLPFAVFFSEAAMSVAIYIKRRR